MIDLLSVLESWDRFINYDTCYPPTTLRQFPATQQIVCWRPELFDQLDSLSTTEALQPQSMLQHYRTLQPNQFHFAWCPKEYFCNNAPWNAICSHQSYADSARLLFEYSDNPVNFCATLIFLVAAQALEHYNQTTIAALDAEAELKSLLDDCIKQQRYADFYKNHNWKVYRVPRGPLYRRENFLMFNMTNNSKFVTGAILAEVYYILAHFQLCVADFQDALPD